MEYGIHRGFRFFGPIRISCARTPEVNMIGFKFPKAPILWGRFCTLLVLMLLLHGFTSITPAQPQWPEELKDWSIPKIDYHVISQKKQFDPRLPGVLEEARKSLNEFKKSFLNNPHEQHRVHQWLNQTAQFVVLLRKAGLDGEAEKILDSFPNLIDSLYHGNMDLRSQVVNFTGSQIDAVSMDTPQKPTLLKIASQLRSKTPDSSGFYRDDDFKAQPRVRSFPMQTAYHAYNPQSSDPGEGTEGEKFATFKQWSEHLIEKYAPNFDAVAEEVENLKRTSQNHSRKSSPMLDLAVLLSVGGRQEEAKNLVLEAIEQMKLQSSDQRRSSSNREPSLKENVIREENSWREIAKTYMRTGESELVLKTLEEMKETSIKLYAAGERAGNWSQQWDLVISDVITWIAREESLDEALPWNEKILNRNQISGTWGQIVLQLARQGREEDVAKILELDSVKIGINRSEPAYLLAEYAVKNLPRDEALSKLNELFAAPNAPGKGLSMERQNAVGLFYLRLDDAETAKEYFTRVNDMIKMNESRASAANVPRHHYIHNVPNDGNTPARILAERYKAGLRNETIRFLETLSEPEFKIPLLCVFIENIAEQSDRDLVKKLLREMLLDVQKIELDPGDTFSGNNPHAHQSRKLYRNDHLWMIAGCALISGNFPEAKTALEQAKQLDAKLPQVQIPPHLMGHFPGIDRSQQWSNYFVRILEKGDLDAALLCIEGISLETQRAIFFLQIAERMIEDKGQGESKAVEEKPVPRPSPPVRRAPPRSFRGLF